MAALPVIARSQALRAQCLVLGVNVHSPRGVSRNHQETLRIGKMAELQLESGILGISGLVFCFRFVVAESTAVSRI